ncbi:TetR/AcrR family transcriptional regulator [Gymnodinialimonas sp.]
MTNRLTPDDWIAAGFRALAESGPEAVKAEPLARRLRSTKGSFYHHFKDVPAFHAAMLAMWQDKAFTGIVAALDDLPSPEAKLRHLAQIANDGAPDRFGGLLIEPAIRAWSLRDAEVARAVAAIDTARIDYVADLLEPLGHPRSAAMLFYGAFVGLDDLQARGMPETAGALSLLVARLLD